MVKGIGYKVAIADFVIAVGCKASPNDLMTFEKFCEELTISPSFAYQLLTEGTIKGIKMGRLWRIPRKSIEEYIMRSLGEK